MANNAYGVEKQDTGTTGKVRTRRPSRPAITHLTISHVEVLNFTVNDAAGITLLLDGIERRVAAVEDMMPACTRLPAVTPRSINTNGHNGTNDNYHD